VLEQARKEEEKKASILVAKAEAEEEMVAKVKADKAREVILRREQKRLQ